MATTRPAPTPMPTTGSTATDVARWTPLVRIRGRSMLPALAPGQLLLTRPAGSVAVGDIVVLTNDRGTRYVKRIAAGPGDVVELEGGRLYVNDPARSRRAGATGAHVASWRVPDGHWFVVGDNQAESDDSRIWRQPFVAASRISGVALRPWPARRRSRAGPRARRG